MDSIQSHTLQTETPRRMSSGDDDLRLSSISLRDFRNREAFDLSDAGPLTILMGPNAVGKTSVIEAIQMVTALKSFRTSQYAQMVRWGSDSSRVDAVFTGGGRHLDVRMTIASGKRSYLLNGKSKRVQDLRGTVPAVSFSPDDLDLVKGPNSNRRQAVDNLGSQLSKNFHAVKSDYEKIIKQRNKALKDDMPDLFVDSIDELLVRVGVQLMSHRMVIMDELKGACSRLYEEISANGERLDLAYIPSWVDVDSREALLDGSFFSLSALSKESFDKAEITRALHAALCASRGRDRARGITCMGPHADKIVFLLNGRNALHFSSQGQQRSIVLSFKLAESFVIQSILGQKPILLLDDVLSELDETRRKYFLSFISDDIQTFITATNAECFSAPILEKAELVELKGGD